MATRKELFERIIDVMADDVEVVEMAEKYIAQITAPRTPRKNKEAEEFAAGVATWMSEHDGPHTLAEMAEDLGVTWQKVNAAITRLKNSGAVEVVEGEDKKHKAYILTLAA